MPVLLVDDESTDGSADVARRAAEKAGKADALIEIQSKPSVVRENVIAGQEAKN
jgi:glycosyltransferase involved in cell wall biosynthesis